MKNVKWIGVLCAAILAAVLAAASVRAADWEVLFDGKNLDAWDYQPGVWEITAQGELHPVKAGPDIATKQRYCDFVIELDFSWCPRKSNSGVFIHVHDRNQDVVTGMEIQVLDNADYGVAWDAGNANGALYDLVRPAVDANKPVDQWHHFKITVNKNLVTVELNGKQIVKADLDQWSKAGQNPGGGHNKFPYAIGALPREGFICLQNYGGTPVSFRNVKIKKLSDRQPKYTGKEPIRPGTGEGRGQVTTSTSRRTRSCRVPCVSRGGGSWARRLRPGPRQPWPCRPSSAEKD